ncbi:MAG: HRDC domain-containing protein, partial [Cyanobacteria bacterium P01_C01_bin.89]
RKRLADAANVPPFVVFHDSHLRKMANKKPTTLPDFADMPGVGRSKLEKYGPDFVQAIATFLEQEQ